MATPNISIPAADFDNQRQALRQFASAQGAFTDVDFDGSYISALIDLLAYNTTMNNFYRNMAVGETNSATAKLRTNVAARAQDNGYIPRSFVSASAVVNIDITSSDTSRANVVVPKGTVVTGIIDNRNFTFSTKEPIVTDVTALTANAITFSTGNIIVSEGIIVSDSYTITTDSDTFEITNSQVDIASISVTVIEDNTVTTDYVNRTSVVGVGPTDRVFFVRLGATGNYFVEFGDGVTGYRPKSGSIVVVDYRVSNGQLPNGINSFTAGQTIDGENNIAITTISSAQGGDVYEDIESIRYNGQQASIKQQRSIYETDFETDIRDNFSIIADINVIGGETLNPPKYGHNVIIGVDKQLNNLTPLEINEITKFLTGRVPLGTQFEFATANILRVGITARLLTNQPTVSNSTRANVISAIAQYADNSVGKFNKPAVESKIQTAIDNSDANIIGNDVTLTAIQSAVTTQQSTVTLAQPIASITTTPFIYNKTSCRLADVNGNVYIVDSTGKQISGIVGSVDYTNGIVTVTATNTSFAQRYDIIVTPENGNILSTGNILLKIQPSDIVIL